MLWVKKVWFYITIGEEKNPSNREYGEVFFCFCTYPRLHSSMVADRLNWDDAGNLDLPCKCQQLWLVVALGRAAEQHHRPVGQDNSQPTGHNPSGLADRCFAPNHEANRCSLISWRRVACQSKGRKRCMSGSLRNQPRINKCFRDVQKISRISIMSSRQYKNSMDKRLRMLFILPCQIKS